MASSAAHATTAGTPADLATRSAVRIGDLAALGNAPRLDRVVVIERVDAAFAGELLERGLHVPGFVDDAARNHRGPAVPLPRKAEAGQGARQHRFLKRRLRPRLPAIDRHVDARDLAVPAPR